MGWNNPPIPWKAFERRLTWAAPGKSDGEPARLRPLPTHTPAEQRTERVPEQLTERPPEPADTGPPWAELHCHSSYSFLDGASDPDALVAEAARLGVEALAITDHDGMYGVVRLAEAAGAAGIGTVFGAELTLGLTARQTGQPDPEGQHLLVLARDPAGYGRLSSAITIAQLRSGEKGRPIYDLAELADAHDGHWVVLTGCRKGAVPAALAQHGSTEAERELRALVEMFGRDNVMVELVDHDQPLDDARNDALFELAGRVGVGVVASNNVHHAAPADAPLAQVLAAVRARSSLDAMTGWLPANGTAHIRSGREMAGRLARFPGVQEATVELARACRFDFRVVAPNLPDRTVGVGHSDASWLRYLVAKGAWKRYGPRGTPQTKGAYQQLDHEIAVIEQLGFPGYFLIVHEITEFCREQGILCQGRGSAANSAVCYALGITSVDPIHHQLLFERFLSAGRDGPPDIDVDIENGRREEVIQHVYQRYGRDRAAQVANVNTYRPKMAVRDAARALGYSPGQADAWSRLVDMHVGPQVGPRGEKEPAPPLPPGVADDAELPALLATIVAKMQRLPRHLSIHSGGMVLCDRPIGEVCPVEWATMPGRTVLQWDKDDCAAAGLVKFDLLGLGMLSTLHDTFDLVYAHHGRRLDLSTIPPDDPATYAMLRDADSIGVFQVESRAQMATLPRMKPENFYDLVVEVALIRPGPIQGGSVHPYLRRKNEQEPVSYPHPSMQNALERTLGVPLFQEQMMQLAIDCAGFDPTEADQLRQAMSSKRSTERIEALRGRLLSGMAERDIPPEIAEDLYLKLFGFASYGFPESHAISFAYLVYASSYLKRYYPAAFTTALLNNQPMGFYAPHTLIADARRHGVQVRGVDVNASAANATLEEPVSVPPGIAHTPTEPQPAIRLGLSTVRNLGEDMAQAIAEGRPYADLDDLVRRVRVPLPALEALATAGAFGCFGLDRREALWAVGAVADVRPDQLPGTTPGTGAPELPAMTPTETTFADLWATGSSPDSHPIQHIRHQLDGWGALTTAALVGLDNGARIRVGGLVTHRQRPPTAGGVVFLNVEDETGMVNVICPQETWERHRRIALESPALLIEGRLECQDGAINLLAQRLAPLRISGPVRSRDFR
ncbi:MAG: error-prone DNA polymerase [Jiangellaceae bacterium]|nr:error-prone DNA polymerase [Jiangellaceae bacterium]